MAAAATSVGLGESVGKAVVGAETFFAQIVQEHTYGTTSAAG